MAKEFDPSRYAKVPGNPAFPPPTPRREEEYIERMIRRDYRYDRRDNTIPEREER